jgi:hypothetical protein
MEVYHILAPRIDGGIAVLSHLNLRHGLGDRSGAAGAVAGVAGAMTSWQQFSGAGRKMNRYTGAIIAIENLVLWWDTLTAVEKSSLANINRLVVMGEGIQMNKVNAWGDAGRQMESTTMDDNTTVGATNVTGHVSDGSASSATSTRGDHRNRVHPKP